MNQLMMVRCKQQKLLIRTTIVIVLTLELPGLNKLYYMKTLTTIGFFFLSVMLTALSCASQVNLSRIVSESRNDTRNLVYVDSSGNGYERGLIGGMRVKVVFRNIGFSKQSNVVKVEGVTTVYSDEKDTVGFCCVNYFIGQPMKGYITKVRKLG